MSEAAAKQENEGDEGGTGTGGGGSSGNAAHDEHLQRTAKQRDAAKARTRELEQQLAAERSKLDALEQEKQDREHELARKAGDFSKIEDGYKSKLAKTEAELAEARSVIQKRERGERSNALAEAVASKTGIKDRAVIRGVLRLASENGFDDAPAELSDDVLAEAIKRVQADAPSLFTTKSTPAANGGTTGGEIEIPAKYANDPQKAAAFLAGVARSPTRK
jgi:uncharacterized protein YihD (DUF1040 family)